MVQTPNTSSSSISSTLMAMGSMKSYQWSVFMRAVNTTFTNENPMAGRMSIKEVVADAERPSLYGTALRQQQILREQARAQRSPCLDRHRRSFAQRFLEIARMQAAARPDAAQIFHRELVPALHVA